jgi:PAS domain S-box-containing protein
VLDNIQEKGSAIMNLVSILDIISLVAAFVSVIFVLFRCSTILDKYTKTALASLLLITLFLNLSNVLEWTGITKSLDVFEDYVEIIQPFLWIFFLYTYMQEVIKTQFRKSEEKFRNLFNNINIGSALHEIITDKNNNPIDFIWLDANPAYEKLTKLKRCNIINKRGLEVIPNLEKKWIDIYGRVAQTGEAITIIDNSNYLNKIWEVKAYSPQQNQFAVALTDITNRIRMEKHQKENSQKLSLMIDQSPIGVSTTNLKGEYLSVNPAYCKMVGFSEEELLGKKFSDHTHPDDIEENKFLNKDLLKQNIHSFDLEKRYIKKNGETIHAFLRSQIVTDENGEPLFELAICEDITKQKKVKTELLRSEMRMKAIYQDALDVIAVVDFKKGSIVDINKSVENILGYKREMLIGKPFNVLFAPETDKTREQLFKELRINGAVFESQNFKREDESICPMDLSITKIPWSDTDAALVNLRDATERTNTEKIIQKDLKEKEVMLMEIHHRVKNNLQIISSMLKMQSVYIKDEKALEYFKDSQNRVKSMSLIHESLYQSEDLSKINLERYIRKLINQLIISFRDDNKNIKTILDIDNISFNINKTIPLGLLINEIVSNSFKYAFLNMTEGKISVFLKKKGESYTLTISDNGVSMPEDLDIENTNSLGLHLVNALISQLHGKLELNRKNGTSFEVEFNLEPEK